VLGLCDEACAQIPPGWRERLLYDWVLWAHPAQLPPGSLDAVHDFVALEDAGEAEPDADEAGQPPSAATSPAPSRERG
jgi:hypothetical protein